MVASDHYNTLLHFRFNPEHSAQRGRHGEGSQRTGHDGKGIELPVPVGTVVYDAETGEELVDFTAPGQRYIVAHGGKGGRGNARFATSTHQAPTEHEDGKPGDSRKLRLELKLLADVGLVGFPNAGKSTLISRLSAAKPKIANYPFTTLEPNLGVVQAGDRTFVMADIPGLIEGAHEGHGLGIQFLKHVERTKMLVHMVDASDFTGRDAGHDFDVIMEELSCFSDELAHKPMIVVASKIDACQDESRVEAVKAKAEEHNLPFLKISSVTGEGLDELRYALSVQVFSAAVDATISVGS
jgi:GTP-binding protein